MMKMPTVHGAVHLLTVARWQAMAQNMVRILRSDVLG